MALRAAVIARSPVEPLRGIIPSWRANCSWSKITKFDTILSSRITK
jgi:hypothetical protein